MSKHFNLLTQHIKSWQQLKAGYRAKDRHKKWQAWRIAHMSKDFKYCHPQWPEERRYIKDEIARIREMKGSRNSGWAYYEWLTVLGIVCVIIMQIIYTVKPSTSVGTAAKFAYLIELFLLWIKLLKPMRSVPAMSSLIVILSKSVVFSSNRNVVGCLSLLHISLRNPIFDAQCPM